VFSLNRRDRCRRADQNIVLVQDRSERFVHIAGRKVASVKPRRAVAETALEQMDNKRLHLVPPSRQQVARDSGKQAFPMG
jgi:hypothetical protein